MALESNRLLKPVKTLPKVLQKIRRNPTPGRVHDLRTKARRIEAMSNALSVDGQGMGKSILKHLNRLRKRAGKVRDIDVLLAYASRVHVDGEDQCLVQLLERLGVLRRKYEKKLALEVEEARPTLKKDLQRATAKLMKRIQKDRNRPMSGPAADAAGLAVRLSTDLAATRRLSRETLHPYRLKVKELRDVIRMAGDDSRLEAVGELDTVKDAIGEWHDWEELLPIAGKTLDHGRNCKLLGGLKGIAQAKYRHALGAAESLRKRYLRFAMTSKKRASTTPRKASRGAMAPLIA
jgi:CHAD domain-containing protein